MHWKFFNNSSKNRVFTREQILLDFENIGLDCEFGLVQRYFDLEPLSLFRFSAVFLENLIDAIDDGLDQYAADGDLELYNLNDYIYCRSKKYLFTYNTHALVRNNNPEAILKREYTKIRYQKTRFLGDLASGDRILLRNQPHSFEEIMRLVTALRRHGPATVLWINNLDGEHEPGTVRWRADGVMEGFLDRSSQFMHTHTVPILEWVRLCANAHALARQSSMVQGPETFDCAVDLPQHVRMHTVEDDESAIAEQVLGKLVSNTMYVFSAWVWLPVGFRGNRVTARVRPPHYGHGNADVSRCGQWQRVWASLKPPRSVTEMALYLRADAQLGERFWSANWRLERGSLPGRSNAIPPRDDPTCPSRDGCALA